MKTHLIPMTQSEVTALREGRKTTHRVPISRDSLPPETMTSGASSVDAGSTGVLLGANDWWGVFRWTYGAPWGSRPGPPVKTCPYAVGDRIAVQEEIRGDGQPGNRRVGIVRYGVDGEMVIDDGGDVCWEDILDDEDHRVVWPASEMPLWAVREFRTIRAISAGRVQDITEDEALAEGIEPGCEKCGNPQPCGCPTPTPLPVDGFIWHWNDRHGPDAWERNDWVWVLEFRTLEAT